MLGHHGATISALGNDCGYAVVPRAGNPIETGGGVLPEVQAGQKEELSQSCVGNVVVKQCASGMDETGWRFIGSVPGGRRLFCCGHSGA